MDKSDPKKLSVSLGTFTCEIEGYDDPMSVLREVTTHMRELSSGEAAFLAQPAERRIVAKPGTTTQMRAAAPQAQQISGQGAAASQPGQAAPQGAPRSSSVQVLRSMARAPDAADAAPPAGANAQNPDLDVVDAPAGEATALSDQDRVDDQALSARMADIIKSKSMLEPKAFFEKMKAQSPSELFEAGAAYLVHFQGYRHVTPKQVNRLAKRAEATGEAGLPNMDELIASLMQSGRIGGNLQEGLTLGPRSPFAPNRVQG